MVEKKEVYKQKIKHKGYWNYKDLYKFCFDLLEQEGYILQEKEYSEKVTSFGKEIFLDWKAEKDVTDYFRYEIQMEWLILGMKDAEVEQDGKKISTNKGEVEIKIRVNLVRDYEERWEDRPFYKFLRSVYEKYIIRTTIDEYEDDLKDKSKGYIKEIKAFLNLSGR